MCYNLYVRTVRHVSIRKNKKKGIKAMSDKNYDEISQEEGLESRLPEVYPKADKGDGFWHFVANYKVADKETQEKIYQLQKEFSHIELVHTKWQEWACKEQGDGYIVESNGYPIPWERLKELGLVKD
jgi:hypothetical protein